jgi:hypothetical protein
MTIEQVFMVACASLAVALAALVVAMVAMFWEPEPVEREE